jgi:hypothetical protein
MLEFSEELGTMCRRLSFLFIILLLLATLAEAFHFHEDGADHPDCSVCAATHHQSDSAYTSPAGEIQRHIAETVYVQPAPTIVVRTFFSLANNRAPPA